MMFCGLLINFLKSIVILGSKRPVMFWLFLVTRSVGWVELALKGRRVLLEFLVDIEGFNLRKKNTIKFYYYKSVEGIHNEVENTKDELFEV